MDELEFFLARREHAEAILRIRQEAAADLYEKLGPGPWGRGGKVESIRQRIREGDPENLRLMTLFMAANAGEPVGTVALSTVRPNFWRKKYWTEPEAKALGVFGLAIDPKFQRQGVGTFVMRETESLAEEHGIRYVRLDAYSVNPFSTTFYRNIGYDERGEIDLRELKLTLFEKAV